VALQEGARRRRSLLGLGKRRLPPPGSFAVAVSAAPGSQGCAAQGSPWSGMRSRVSSCGLWVRLRGRRALRWGIWTWSRGAGRFVASLGRAPPLLLANEARRNSENSRLMRRLAILTMVALNRNPELHWASKFIASYFPKSVVSVAAWDSASDPSSPPTNASCLDSAA
jgi:hypothetical protein